MSMSNSGTAPVRLSGTPIGRPGSTDGDITDVFDEDFPNTPPETDNDDHGDGVPGTAGENTPGHDKPIRGGQTNGNTPP